MEKYQKTPLIKEKQLQKYKGKKGQVLKVEESGDFVAMDGIKVGGYRFKEVDKLERYLATGYVPPAPVVAVEQEEEIEEKEEKQEEEKTGQSW